MQIERFQAIVDAYGTHTCRWPASDRPAAEAFLAREAEAQRYLAAARALDNLLDADPPALATTQLRQSILARTSRSGNWLDQLIEWLLPVRESAPWRPVLVASLTLAIGIGVGLNVEIQTSPDPWDDELELLGFETWVTEVSYE